MDMRINDNEDAVKQIKSDISQLSYRDKISIYNSFFDLGSITSRNLNSRLMMFNLICLVTYNMRKKNPDVTVLQVLTKIVGAQNITKNSNFSLYLEGLSIVCENLMYECIEFDSCGLKNSDAVIEKIKELLDEWLPF